MGERSEIIFGKGFLADVRKLPKNIQEKVPALIEIGKEDVFDPRLHTKPLGAPLKGKFSFRITRDWRTGFEFLGPRVIHLLAVDHRSRIYKRFSR